MYVSAVLGIGTRKLSGPRLLTEIKIGNNPILNVEGSYKPLNGYPTVGIGLLTRYWQESGTNISFNELHSRLNLFVEDGRFVWGRVRLGLSTDFSPLITAAGDEGRYFNWMIKNRWHSAFADICLDTFNDGYFPTKGFRVDLDSRYMFRGFREGWEAEGQVTTERLPNYFIGLGSVSAALTSGRWTLLPSLYLGYTSATMSIVHPTHELAIGGLVGGRYVDYQIPFFGMNRGMRALYGYVASPQVNLQYRISHKNYLTARSGLFANHYESFKGMFKEPLLDYAFGLDFGRKTVAGPFRFGLAWSKRTHFGGYFSFGYDF